MCPVYSDFSGRYQLPVERYLSPTTLPELVAAIRESEARGASVHAVGTGWAFSAPAYTGDTMIRTGGLCGFPPQLQRAIREPERGGGRVLIGVEAGKRIREFYLALSGTGPNPPLQVTVEPAVQQLDTPVTLVVTVRDDVGQPVGGAKVQITTHTGDRPSNEVIETALADANGVATIGVTLRQEYLPDDSDDDRPGAGSQRWIKGDLPHGTATAPGFADVEFLSFHDQPVVTERAPLYLPSTVRRGRHLAMVTMGGVGAQTLAGATSTGTHGGDVARAPIGDYIRAMIVVGAGGVVRLLQRHDVAPVVDINVLNAEFAAMSRPVTIQDATGTEAFLAAQVALGRLGVVYACVFEVEDASDLYLYQSRTVSVWDQVKPNLLAWVDRARNADQFLQVALSPVPAADGGRPCYITRQALLPRARVATARAEFSDPVVDGDPSAYSSSTVAAGDPTVCVTNFVGQGPRLRIVYRSPDRHLQELSSADPGAGVFALADLTRFAQGVTPAGDPSAVTTDFAGQGHCLRIMFRGTAGQLFELASLNPAAGQFEISDLTKFAAGTKAAGKLAVCTTNFAGQGPCLRIVYRAEDGHLYDLWSTNPASGQFAVTDLTSFAAGATAAGDPSVCTTDFPGQGHCVRVMYRGVDGHLHEAASTNPLSGVWGTADLTVFAGAVPAAGDPSVCTTDFAGQGHCLRVVYRGTDNHIHEIASTNPASGAFGSVDLTAFAGAVPAAGDPSVCTTDFAGQGHCLRVVYRGTDNHIHEIASTNPASGTFSAADLTAMSGVSRNEASMAFSDYRRLPGPALAVPTEWQGYYSTLEGLAKHCGFSPQGGLQPGRLCSAELNDQLRELQTQLHWVGFWAPALLPGRDMFGVASKSIDRISPTHKIGDVLADALNVGPASIVGQVINLALQTAQQPHLIHGTRAQISDNYDYSSDCYRGDAVEIFFAADDQLLGRVEDVLAIFDSLRARGMLLAAWISLRFLAPSKALLATAAFSPVTCAIEVAMLRGMRANDEALAKLQTLARTNGGFIHWGQRNDLNGAQVETMFGDRYRRWRTVLTAIEATPADRDTFSNPFSVSHGLEPI